jgi:hypothetical protein
MTMNEWPSGGQTLPVAQNGGHGASTIRDSRRGLTGDKSPGLKPIGPTGFCQAFQNGDDPPEDLSY